MAASKCIPLVTLCSLLIVACNAHNLDLCRFEAIYLLGDSISDTGNDICENPFSPFARLPYGQALGKPTGRCSDGLLLIDNFAQSAGLPFLEPFLSRNATFAHGANFAVAGATALPALVLAGKGILNPLTVNSLSQQLIWMDIHFKRTCFIHPDCTEKLKKSLFIVGEIGGNDYNYALIEGKTVEEVKAFVPEVVQTIKDAVTRVVGYGATRVIVPGNFPIGCFPIYLTSFQTSNASAYDKYHCLKDLNEFSMHQNNKLQQAIQQLSEENPNVTVVYADYYKAFLWLLDNAMRFGFDPSSIHKACCGIGGDYNFSLFSLCGVLPGVPVCPNPDRHVSWDGIHLTQQAYKIMAKFLINDISPKLHCQTRKDYKIKTEFQQHVNAIALIEKIRD